MSNYFYKNQDDLFISANFLHIHNLSFSQIKKKIITNDWNCIQITKGSKSLDYILYSSISELDRKKYSIPDKSKIEDLAITHEALSTEAQKESKKLEIKLLIEMAYKNFMKYVPYYYQKGLDIDVIYKYAKSHAVLDVMLKIKKSTHGVVELLYNTIKNEEFSDLLIANYNIKYFYKVLKMSEGDSIIDGNKITDTLIHGLIGKKSNNRKINKTISNVILYFARNGNKATIKTITNQTNAIILAWPTLNGGKKISNTLVGNVIRDPHNNNLINIYRSSPGFLNNELLPHLSLIDAKYPCDAFEIDGTKLQFACKDKQNNIITLTIVYVLDSYSKRILGYSLGSSEDSDLVKEAFEMSIYATGYLLPTQITTDGASAFKGRMTRIKEYTANTFGVKWISSSNPKRKSTLERLIRTIQTVFLSPSFGYIGAGIKSINKNERPNGDVLLLLRDPSYLHNSSKIEGMMADVIHKYNTIPLYENDSSPLELFKDNRPKNAFKILFWQTPYIFWAKHTLMVKNSMVTIYEDKREYIYKSYVEDLVLKINHTKVDCYFKKSAHKQIFIFLKNTDQFLGTMDLFTRVHKVLVNQSKKDRILLNEHFKKRKSLENALIKKVKNTEKELVNDLGLLPSELINYKIDDKEYMAKTEVLDILGLERDKSKALKVNLFDTPAEVQKSKKRINKQKPSAINSSFSIRKGSLKKLE